MNKSKGKYGYLVVIGVFLLIAIMINGSLTSEPNRRIEYPQLLNMIEKGEVGRVALSGTTLYGLKVGSRVVSTDFPERNYDFTTTVGSDFLVTIRQMEAKRIGKTLDEISIQDLPYDLEYIAPTVTPWWYEFLPMLISMGLILLLWFFIMRAQMGGSNKAMSFGKSNAQKQDPAKNKVTFADVAGADEEKEELQEMVDFLRNPKAYLDMGAKIPRGVLLVGPPGTGKTLLAKAVAGEAGVPFFSISGSDFVEMFVGVGASRVRDLFDQAKRNAPAIVFIDEIDAVGRHRGAGLGGGHDEREQTLNQLLVEMDGFSGNEGVIVMAATNRRDILDPALMRPGRFDRQVTVNYPDMEGRIAVLKVHSKGKPLAADVDLANIAKRMPYSTGADLANVMNEAAILAARNKQKTINQKTIVAAIERVQMGPEKRSHKVHQQDKNLVAYHEGGHAIVGHFLPHCDEVHLITIVPRGSSGGHTLLLPAEELDMTSRSELIDRITMALGGRAAEQVALGEVTTGAVSDLKHATDICRQMVTRFGMSEKLGTIYLDNDQEVFVGMEFGQSRAYSEEVAATIDAEVKRILDSCYQKAIQLLIEHRSELDALRDALLKYDTLNRAEFLQVLNGDEPVMETALPGSDAEAEAAPDAEEAPEAAEGAEAAAESAGEPAEAEAEEPEAPEDASKME